MAEDLARWYDAQPLTTPRAHAAYRVVAAYVNWRFFHDVPRSGWTIRPVHTGDTPDLPAAIRQHELPVFVSSLRHPELSDAENYRFRVVHDLYGHGLVRVPKAVNRARHLPHEFGLENEQRATLSQCADFCRWFDETGAYLFAYSHSLWRDAQAAIRGEIFAQAAYREARGVFPHQRAVLLVQ